MTRIGLVGCGRWGKNAARAMSNAGVLAWVADQDEDAARCLSREFSVPFHQPSYVADHGWTYPWGEVSACWIATPIPTHELLVHDALTAGKHVLCEKPLSRSKAQAEDLAADAERRGLTLMCDFTWLGHAAVRDMVSSAGIVSYGARRLANDDRGFDPLEDLLPHDAALSVRAMGRVRNVSVARGCSVLMVHDNGPAMPNGAVARRRGRSELEYAYDSPEKVRCVGIIANDPTRRESNTGDNYPGAPEPLSVILDEFIASIREHRQPRIGGAAESIHVAAVIEAAKASRARGGEWVDVV